MPPYYSTYHPEGPAPLQAQQSSNMDSGGPYTSYAARAQQQQQQQQQQQSPSYSPYSTYSPLVAAQHVGHHQSPPAQHAGHHQSPPAQYAGHHQSPSAQYAGHHQSSSSAQQSNGRHDKWDKPTTFSARSRQVRPLTVNEALQYTPLTSIVPLDSTTISLPSAEVPVSYPLFPNKTEFKNARRALEHLDNTAEKLGRTKEIDDALEHLQNLLKKESLTEFIFKCPDSGDSSETQPSPPSQRVGNVKRLSTFANLVLKRTEVSCRYAKPPKPKAQSNTMNQSPALSNRSHPSPRPLTTTTTTTSQSPALSNKSHPSPRPLNTTNQSPALSNRSHPSPRPLNTPITPRHIQENKEAYAQNARISAHAPQTVAPEQLSLQPQVLVPSATVKQENKEAYTQNARISAQAPQTVAPEQLSLQPQVIVPSATVKQEKSEAHAQNAHTSAQAPQTVTPAQLTLQPQTIVPSATLIRRPEEFRPPKPVEQERSKEILSLKPQIIVPSAALSRKADEYKVYKESTVNDQSAPVEVEDTTINPGVLQLQPKVVIAPATLTKKPEEYRVYVEQPPPEPQVVVTLGTVSGDPNQYKVYQERPDLSDVNSLKRKHDEVDEVELNQQRAVADTILESFLDFSREIFEAEDSFHLDGARSNFDAYFMLRHDSEEGDVLIMAPATQVKLDSLLQKVVSYARFADVPLETIIHIQKLCENAVRSADSCDISIKSGWSDDEISAWLEKLETIDIATRAARTLLRTMTGNRQEKELYSEEVLQKTVKLVCKITKTCIVPMVESRIDESDASIFNVTSRNKKVMSQLLHNAGKIMQLLLDLLAKEEFGENLVNEILGFVTPLLFVENSPSEKESVLGISKFEVFRRTAMNIIATIFSKYPEQRQHIIPELLTSLQKLPTAKIQGRQFKLGDGTRLQLVSVLLVRLVQTSGMRTVSTSEKQSKRLVVETEKESEAEESEEEESDDEQDKRESKENAGYLENEVQDNSFNAPIPQPLINNAKKLYDTAGASAQQIVKYLVGRASKASKSGDQPHRHLLDMFVEDLIAVVNLPEWPAAELLLRALVSTMVEIVQSKDTNAPAKVMALETLGTMATAILDVTAVARQFSRGAEIGESTIDEQLAQQLEDHWEGNLEITDLADYNGPFRVVLEFLEENSGDSQTSSAKGYFLTQWTKFVLWGSKSTNDSPENVTTGISRKSHALNLCKILYNGKWSSSDDFEPVSYAQCRLAYLLTLLNVGFCRAFGHIFNVILQACSSDQTTVKTRAIKSVALLLEKDPPLIDRAPQIRNVMFQRITDPSPMVRDTTLTLISKCIESKPELELEFMRHILHCTNDSTHGIRKRAMKTLKDVYTRHSAQDSTSSKDLRPIVAECILQRVEDEDEGAVELAKQIMEEAWLVPYWTLLDSNGATLQNKFALKEQVSLIIQTMQRSTKITSHMEAFLRYAMSGKFKNHEQSTRVCKAFVAAGFEGIIDSSELPGEPQQRFILQMLTVFAQANPKLFTQQQLAHLQPYISDLTSSDDVNLFRWIVIIFRCVLPILPSIQKEFLKRIQDDLLRNVTKLAKPELNEAASCLWTINGVLQNIERLVNVEVGVLAKLHKLEATKLPQTELSPAEQASMKTIQRLIHLAGHFGRHCDFQSQNERFKTQLPWLKGDLVAAKIVGGLMPYAARRQPVALRAVALESIGMVCQAWPRNFTQADIARLFLEVLREESPILQKIVLTSFRDFFAAQDQQFTAGALSNEKDPLSGGKLGGSMTASDNDSAASLIAQGFLKDVLHIALSSQDEDALTATEVVASITRQGLVHPRECGPALVALETSTNPRIADVALQQHYNLHQQHESLFEREYMRAIHEAFLYQKNIAHDSTGFTKPDIKAKLHSMYEVVKTSKSKYQAKFLSYYSVKMDFDIAKLDVSADPPEHFEYARFLAENMAFFEYGRVEDVVQAVNCIEKIVGGTGAGIAHSINTEIFKVTLDPETGAPLQVPDGVETSIDVPSDRLRLLTTASMILSMLWEVRTFIRKQWNISSKDIRRENKAKKESHKAPTKDKNVTGDRLVEAVAKISSALDSRELSLAQCKAFADLLAIDNEVKVAVEGDDDRLQTPSDDEDAVVPTSAGSKTNKRRRSGSMNGTPSKKKRGKVKKSDAARKNSVEDADADADGDADDWV